MYLTIPGLYQRNEVKMDRYSGSVVAGIYSHADKIRDNNITKKEGVLMVQQLFMEVPQN